MYLAETRLPHVLSPDAYRLAQWAEAEAGAVFRPSWHAVATTTELARPGDFVTADLCGTAVQVRRFGDELVGLSNVCVHRHCLIDGRPAGNTPTMRCPYHGWEYGADGRTRKVPAPRNFVPFDRDGERLARYRVETCGGLVFVCPNPDESGVRDHLGPVFDLILAKSGPGWRPFLSRDRDVPVNWKVPVEASLESYHVPAVHPGTFREDPGEDRSRHELNPRHTSFATPLPFSSHSRLDDLFQKLEGGLLRRFGFPVTGLYEHHHVFPNLLVSHTDTLLLVQCVLPTGPTACRIRSWQFGRVGETGRVRRRVMGAWGGLAAGLTSRILAEDASVYPRVQAGLNVSHGRGVLGRCEERIHAYQVWLSDRVRDRTALDIGVAEPCVPETTPQNGAALAVRQSVS